jgi:hypothetical protein
MPQLTEKQKEHFRDRLAEKLHRLAYDLEHDAARSRDFMPQNMAESVRSISSSLGTLARRMKRD